jgi:hypothetical protein
MIRFPNMIDWIDDLGLDELHRLHNEDNEGLKFGDFVEKEYLIQKKEWTEVMCHSNKTINGTKKSSKNFNFFIGEKILRLNFDENKDVATESAKIVLERIINISAEKGLIKDIILCEELAPDYYSCRIVAESFWYKIIPAIKKTLDEME